ncbi:hypothetical protein DPMN_153273 [Dreissena polymorpha]|uniref:Uncharacterized protein n=1 Tax=Dreissena polymorpha TaxID=45954 RepID=A0A9D4FJU6_DREPO|nr:hypothetical protein DPMN_153273 [Dreissena polymorpha]
MTKAKTLQPPSGELKLTWPMDVHVTKNGQVLVCCCGSKEIVQLNKEGKKILGRIAVSGSPACVCFSKKRGMLLVGLNASNKIQVFKTRQLEFLN